MIQQAALPELPVALIDAEIGCLSLVTQRAQAKLAGSPYPPLRRLFCVESKGVLTLRGEVSSFFHKQMAQAAMLEIPGVEEISNQVRVIEAGSPRLPR